MFTIFDIVVLSIISLSSILGVYKGFISIIINLLSFIASIIGAIFMYHYIQEFFIHYIKNEFISMIVSATISYIISLIIFGLIAVKINTLLSFIRSSFLDKLGGLIFGIIRGIIISLCIFSIITIGHTGAYSKASNSKDMVLYLQEDQYPEWLEESRSTLYLHWLMVFAIDELPEYKFSAKINESVPFNTDSDL